MKNITHSIYALAVAAALAMAGCGGDGTHASLEKASMAQAGHEAVVQDAVLYATGAITPDATLPIVIDFNATWCGPCLKFAPVFHEVAEELRGKALFMSVDIDTNPGVAREFGVQAIPQVTILYPSGETKTAVGFMSKEDLLRFVK